MPGGDWSLYNYRLDARGHVQAVQLYRMDYTPPYTQYWRWYNLNGTLVASGTTPQYPHNTLGLRLDARGHVIAVLAYYADGQPYHWFDLNGQDLGAQSGSYDYVMDIRLDARGHVLAVKMSDGHWYNLDGQVV